jgi:hypothetical protein
MSCKKKIEVTVTRAELADTERMAPTFVEARTIYQAADACKPKVEATTAAAATGVSGEACNLAELRAGKYYVSGNFTTNDGITISGCGTPTSPWTPHVDFALLTQQIVGDGESGATYNKCGWKVKAGIVTAVGAFVGNITSADNTLTIKKSADGCTTDISLNPVGNDSLNTVLYTRPICLQCSGYTVLGMAWVERSGGQFIVMTCATTYGQSATISAGSGPFDTFAEAVTAAQNVTMGGCQTDTAGGA